MKIPKIYGLVDPRGEHRYTGVTIQSLKKRLAAHIGEARRGGTGHRCDWIRSLLLRGEAPHIVWIDEAFDESDGYALEAAYIQFHHESGIALVNGTLGGDCGPRMCGANHPLFGKPRSPETRKKIGLAGRGRKSTSEGNAARSEKLSGPLNPNFGKPASLETRAKQRAAKLGVSRGPMPLETRRKIGTAQSGEKNHNFGKIKPHTPEAIEKMRLAAVRRGPWTPELRATILAAHARKRAEKGVPS